MERRYRTTEQTRDALINRLVLIGLDPTIDPETSIKAIRTVIESDKVDVETAKVLVMLNQSQANGPSQVGADGDRDQRLIAFALDRLNVGERNGH